MSYKIIYYKRRRKKHPRLLVYMTALLLLLFAARHGDALDSLRYSLLPGQTAVASLISQLQNGESISEAVSTFCQELLHGTH